MEIIKEFQREYRFLSNFWPAEVMLDGVQYPSVEHAYVASKTLDLSARHVILKSTPGQAKRYGRSLKLRSDWERVKIPIMQDLVSQKFAHPDLSSKLLETGNAELIEGNTWGDAFWGVCNGVGENHLGKILMGVRNSLAAASAAAPQVVADERQAFEKLAKQHDWDLAQAHGDGVTRWLNPMTRDLYLAFLEGRAALASAPVQPVAVPDDGRDAALDEAAELVLGCHQKANRHGIASAIRMLKNIPIAASAAQVDAKDAERYRYIRDTGTLDAAVWAALEGYGCADEGDIDQVAYAAGMDQAIDAAIAAKAAL